MGSRVALKSTAALLETPTFCSKITARAFPGTGLSAFREKAFQGNLRYNALI